MNQINYLSYRAKIAYSVKIEETIRLLNKKHGKTINFGIGQAAPEAIPYDFLKNTLASLSKKKNENELRPIALYGPTRGSEECLNAVKLLLKKDGIQASNENICITGGALEGFYLTTRAIANKGDTVSCEAPTYSINLKSLIEQQFNIVGIPVNKDGIDLNFLENLLKSKKIIKFLYVIPDFQNPCGTIMPLNNRNELIYLARKYKVVIIEDGPYRLISYGENKIPPTLYSIAPDITFFIGSVSKILGAGFRIGFVVGNKQIIERIRRFKQCIGFNIPQICQEIITKFIKNEIVFNKCLNQIITIQREKRDLMLLKLEENISKKNRIQWTKPEGGIFIWVELPEYIESELIWLEAIEQEGVGIIPGKGFFPKNLTKNNFFRLNFSFPSREDIISGIPKLAKIVKKHI